MFAFSACQRVSVCVGARECERQTARARQEASPEDWQLWQSLHAGLNARLVQSGSGSSGCLAPSRRPMTLIPCYCISQLLQRGPGLAPCCPPPLPSPPHSTTTTTFGGWTSSHAFRCLSVWFVLVCSVCCARGPQEVLECGHGMWCSKI